LATILVAGFVLEPKIQGAIEGSEDVLLEIAEPTLSNPRDDYWTIGGELRQDPKTEPTVAATVRNRGAGTAWIEEARITVVAGARLYPCVLQGGGDVPRSQPYRVLLPNFPAREARTISRDLHVEVQPGHGVRPVLRFALRDPDASTGLFAIRVAFVADPGGHVLDAGRFVVSVPGPVGRYLLPEDQETLTGQVATDFRTAVSACFRHNLEAVRRVIAGPGRRSSYTAALEHVFPAPAWRDFAATPAHAVVAKLLDSDDGENLRYAVDAAARAGDPELEKQVRQRATARLIRLGREELDGHPPTAVIEAERALSLEVSAAARRLLWRARAAQRAKEDEP
jgi:hypothetical protein